MTGQKLGRSLKIFLVDGTPSGLITAEMGVSSLKAVVANRTSLPELIARPEAGRTGVYLLLGPSEVEEDTTLVYIGEGDSVKSRLANHDSDESKGFFDRVALIVSKDDNLTKAHGRYLESRLIQLIRRSGQAKLANGTFPVFEGLPEAEIADMERVLEEITTILPVVGFDLFKAQDPLAFEKRRSISNLGEVQISAPVAADRGEFVAKIKKAEAEAVEEKGSFTLLAGSQVHREEQSSFTAPLRQRRVRLRENGILIDTSDPELWELTENTSFGSPSADSAFVAGRSANGRTTWRTKRGNLTYAEWRERKLKDIK